MKTCSCCGKSKPLDEFQVRNASKDGLTSSCKSCLKQRDSARYEKERVYRSEKHKKYMATPEGKAAHSRATAAWKSNNAVRRAANVILGSAVKRGKIQKQPCWVCGKNAEAHHPDYDRPLDVVWLCNTHHREVHAMVSRIQF